MHVAMCMYIAKCVWYVAMCVALVVPSITYATGGGDFVVVHRSLGSERRVGLA